MLNREALPNYSACVLDAESGKLDIKRREPGILFSPGEQCDHVTTLHCPPMHASHNLQTS